MSVTEDWPDGFYLIGELRRAVGLFDGAMSKTPREAWEEAISEVERICDVAQSGKCWVCEKEVPDAG